MTAEERIQSAKWLKKERSIRGISRAALGKYVNVAYTTLCHWETDGIPHNYVCQALRYFFDGWEKNCLRKCPLNEIPDHPQLATGKWLSWWLNTEAVSVAELAERLGVTAKCVYDWMKPDKKIPIIAEYAIRKAMKDLGK